MCIRDSIICSHSLPFSKSFFQVLCLSYIFQLSLFPLFSTDREIKIQRVSSTGFIPLTTCLVIYFSCKIETRILLDLRILHMAHKWGVSLRIQWFQRHKQGEHGDKIRSVAAVVACMVHVPTRYDKVNQIGLMYTKRPQLPFYYLS